MSRFAINIIWSLRDQVQIIIYTWFVTLWSREVVGIHICRSMSAVWYIYDCLGMSQKSDQSTEQRRSHFIICDIHTWWLRKLWCLATSDVLGRAQSPKPAQAQPIWAQPSPAHMWAWIGLGLGLQHEKAQSLDSSPGFNNILEWVIPACKIIYKQYIGSSYFPIPQYIKLLLYLSLISLWSHSTESNLPILLIQHNWHSMTHGHNWNYTCAVCKDIQM